MFLSGLLLGAGVGGHVLRLVMLHEEERQIDELDRAVGTDTEAWARRSLHGRMFVAWSAVAVYTMATVLVGLGHPAGLMIAVVGPVVGASTVVALRARIDRFQIALGVFQGLAAALALYRLIVVL